MKEMLPNDKNVKYVKPKEEDLKLLYSDMISLGKSINLTDISRDLDSSLKLGDVIYYARLSKGMSQSELAKILDIRQNTLSRYETNSRQMPFDVFFKAMTILGLKMTIEAKDKKNRD